MRKRISRKSVQKFMESRLETGPKGEDRRSNRTRQNDKRADRKMESNDRPEIPDKGDIRRA